MAGTRRRRWPLVGVATLLLLAPPASAEPQPLPQTCRDLASPQGQGPGVVACDLLAAVEAACFSLALPLTLCHNVFEANGPFLVDQARMAPSLLESAVVLLRRLTPPLPTPTPGSVPALLDQGLAYLDEAAGEDEVQAVADYVVGDPLQDHLTSSDQAVRDKAADGSRTVQRIASEAPPEGTTCGLVHVVHLLAEEDLARVWELVGAGGAHPALPNPCGPTGPDLTGGWIPQ
jgi:hypothetical protein